MKWNEVIGQQKAKERLQTIVASGKVPHAMMLCGDTGSGTLALAMAMASRLLCTEPDADGNACGTCPQCAMLRQWHHPDLHFSYPIVNTGSGSSHKPVSDDFSKEWNTMICQDGPYISMNQWLERMKAENKQAIITAAESDDIARKLSLKSSQGGYKVCIIWMAEAMNGESANKILKTLEEPPQQTVFILCVEDPERLLTTIRSRVQRIDVPSIDEDTMTHALMEHRGLDESTARQLTRAVNGNWVRALEQLSPDCEEKMFLSLFVNLMRCVYKRDVQGLSKWSETIGDKSFGREKQKRLLLYFQRMIRESFMSNFQEPALLYATADEAAFIKNFGRFVNEKNVIEITELLHLAFRDITQNVSAKVVMFDTALRMTRLLLRK